MSLKTTIALILLCAFGAGGWGLWLYTQPAPAPLGPTVNFLQNKIAKSSVTKVEVSRGPKKRFVFEKHDNQWTQPGNWPLRDQEVAHWLDVLTSLRTRFVPIPIDDQHPLASFGLDENPLTIKISAGNTTRTLQFGEQTDSAHGAGRVTFVRLEDEKEVLRLGPDVFRDLDRELDTFLQKRLFPIERVDPDGDSKEKVKQLAAAEVEVTTKEAKFVVAKKQKEWSLRSAHTRKDNKDEWKLKISADRLDPERRSSFLQAFANLWVEFFVAGKTEKECGLDDPEYIVSVVFDKGKPRTLKVGKVSRTESRKEKKQGPPQMPPMATTITEEYRYAMLEGNSQLFEIKTDKLTDIAVAIDNLRDARLARFKVDDVKRIEIRNQKQETVLVKSKEKDQPDAKEKWRFEKPTKDEADEAEVEKFLSKLEQAQVGEKEIHDGADAKSFGLAAPQGHIKITLEETDKEARKDQKEIKKKTRVIDYQLGVKEQDDDKLYVGVDAWPRINEVGSDLRKLISRGDLAYRPRELWRLDSDDIARITIEVDGTPFHLERSVKGWKLGAPINAEVPGKEIEALANELAHVTAERFEANQPKGLAAYGLDKPAFKIIVEAKDGKSHALEIGSRLKEKDGGRFARLKDGKAVIVVSEKLTAPLRKDPLEWLDKTLWTLNPADVQRIKWQGTASFALEQKKGPWQVVDAPVPSFIADEQTVKTSVFPLLQLRAEKYIAFGDKLDLAKYDLEKPATTITITLKDGDKTFDRVVKLGKEAPGGGRYAQVSTQNGVVVLDADFVEDVQVTHLDFVDRRLLRFDGDAVMLIERKMQGNDVELTRREDNWFITKPGTRDADLLTIADMLRKTSQLQAKRIAAAGEKDLAKYGLEKPVSVVTLQLESPDGSTSKHVIKVGNLVKDKVKKDTDERFAMIDDRPVVAVLPADLSRHLVAAPLYFADRNLASFASVDWLELKRGPRTAVFTRADGAWRLKQPIDAAAMPKVIDEMIQSLQRLRADEIIAIADKGTDLKKYGLDQPFLTWRFKTGESEQLYLMIGGLEKDEPGARRFAKLGDKAPIFLLNSKVIARVSAECRDRAVGMPFEPAAVTKLTVTGDGKTFSLSRKDAAFVAADDPAAKINQVDVSNTLEMLGSLKAIRYATDAKPDLKNYGLEKPAWKLQIELGKDKREVWLGDFEDKSKRRYATLSGSGAVFVLDEIDVLILARPRSAYVEEPKKAEENKGALEKRVLLLWQSPDGHPKDTHEYLAGQKILKRELQKFPELEVVLVNVDEPWPEGPELLSKADGVVLFISEGAKWLSADAKRLEAFRACAKRKAGLSVLHWGMGSKDAKNIDAFVELFGGCHGGPDRKYQVVSTDAKVIGKHPIVTGLVDFKVRDEFYYTLKFAKNKTPLLNVTIDDQAHPVAWALERDGGGRSFGFSGLHFHENWQMPEYRRLVTQGVLWTLDAPIPKDGIKTN